MPYDVVLYRPPTGGVRTAIRKTGRKYDSLIWMRSPRLQITRVRVAERHYMVTLGSADAAHIVAQFAKSRAAKDAASGTLAWLAEAVTCIVQAAADAAKHCNGSSPAYRRGPVVPRLEADAEVLAELKCLRELWYLGGLDEFRDWTKAQGYRVPPIELCLVNADARWLGLYIGPEARGGQHLIQVHLNIPDGREAAATFAHELAHAALPAKAYHGPKFKRLARRMGLGGPLTSTVWTEEFDSRVGHFWTGRPYPQCAAAG